MNNLPLYRLCTHSSHRPVQDNEPTVSSNKNNILRLYFSSNYEKSIKTTCAQRERHSFKLSMHDNRIRWCLTWTGEDTVCE